jgi:predicted AlkP superfamily pyrophosphatase or phosphodiesterase
MRRFCISVLCLLAVCSQAQTNKKVISKTSASPKLVVGIVVDQMRWDYLYRYANRFGSGGFKRMMNEGFNCENTMIPYTPTVTAAGHTCVYTGSVPNIHGITGNNWYDSKLNKPMYCTEDANVKSVGTPTKDGQMSPKNMLVTTICDELRIATNNKAKVIGIALKDRGAILPAGHNANAAYWYDNDNASFVTSTWYMNSLPAWVNDFNNRKTPDSLMALGWNTLYPIATYTQSTVDEKPYEGKYKGMDNTSFPYNFKGNKNTDNWDMIRSTPQGNTLTAEFAKAAVLSEGLGKDSITDMLAVSFSSPDYIGHQFGPNSIENEDDYLRLDKELASFFLFLDKEVGKGQYTVFLSADHAVAHVPGYSIENKLPGGIYSNSLFTKEINKGLKDKLGLDSIVVTIMNYQVHLNHPLIKAKELDEEKITEWIIDYLYKQDVISQAFALDELMEQPINKTLQERIGNGYSPGRSGDIQFIPKPGFVDAGKTGTSHGLWNPYDSHIPLLFMGWGVQQGSTHRETYMTDIAATVAAILKIQMPNGCVGKVIEEVVK